MKKLYLITLGILLSNTAFGMESEGGKCITEKDCSFVLKSLNQECEDSSLQSTYTVLKKFLSDKQIIDYATAASYGRSNETFKSPDEFSLALRHLFIKNTEDVYPEVKKIYQAFIFNTSGIDVFMERLAYLARLLKHGFQVDKLYALVGTHAHRQDLMDLEYLLGLIHLFYEDISSENYNEDTAKKHILDALEKGEWQHRDGMALAWKLVSCDENMAKLGEKFEYYDGNDQKGLRSAELLKSLISHLEKPISPENPIGLICNSQGATQVKAMINEYMPNNDSIDIFIAKPIEDSIEGILFNDTPQQRAMTKLFSFYRILETIVNAS